MDVVTLGAALSIMKKMPDTAASSAAAAEDAADRAEAAAEQAEGAIEVDDTLSIEGRAADAKVTGDRFGRVEGGLSKINAHFIESINLFNPNDLDLVEDVELNGSGTTSAKTGYFASGYIPVKAGLTVCCHYPIRTYGSNSKFVWYNANKERIGYSIVPSENRLTDANGNNYIRYTFGETVEAAYFRLTGYMANESYYMYVYADSMPSTYVPYTDDFSLADDVTVDFSNIKNVSVSKSDTDFVKTNPKNLVDLSEVVVGIFSNSTSNGNIDSTVTTWRTTDFISVIPGHKYSFVDFVGVYRGANNIGYPAYDKNKNFVTRIVPDGGKSANSKIDVLTIPNNDAIAYIRTCYPVNSVTIHKQWYQTMVVEGETWAGSAYIPYDGAVRVQGAGLSKEFSAPLNCLFGKVAIWNGDSICAADNDPNGGWPITIAKANGMQAKNYGIAGGTIAENTGTTVHSVSATLDGMLTDFPDADYIIIEGGTNDADILGDSGIGTFDANDFTDAYIEALDKDTFSGALESIFYRLVTIMKGKHIGYLIPQKMGYTEVLVTRRRTYFDRAIAICQKWGIPYLDLWNGFYFNWRLSAHWDQTKTSAENNEANNFYRDGQHLTDYGYIVESPVIAEWMKTI